MLGIDLAEPAGTVLNWGNNLGLTYPLLLDPNYSVYNQYGMNYIPHNAILDTNMVVLYTNYGYDKSALMSIINSYLPTPPSIQSVHLNERFMVMNQDTISMTTQLDNPSNFNLTAKAIISSLDSTVMDSILLYDDGLHNDSLAGDLLYGGYISPRSEENDFSVGIKIIDNDNNVTSNFPDQERFSTIGPLEFDSYLEVMRISNRILYKISVINLSQSQTAQNISVRLTTNDPNITSISGNYQNFGNIAAGQTVQSPQNYGIFFSSMPNSFTFPLSLEIFSDGYLFWKDNTDIVVGIRQSDPAVPEVFALKQNYPNPFNPATIIEFSLPEKSDVSLKIYDILGKQLETLISQPMSAGTYQYQWNAADLTSGVYFYRLEAGDYSAMNKAVLMK